MQETVLQSFHKRPLSNYDNANTNEEVPTTRKSSAVVQPIQMGQSFLHTPQKEAEPVKHVPLTPVLPTTRTVTRLLPESPEQNNNPVFPYPGTAGHFVPAYRHALLQNYPDLYKRTDINKSTSEDEIDVVNDSQEHLRTGDAPNNTDSSISTLGSTSSSPASTDSAPSPSGSVASPESGSGSTTSPDIPQGPPKKKSRTNYSPSQVQALERVFHENPYPDPEMMETLSKDLGIPEGKIKIWFQNKRARWRRRVNDNVNRFPQFMPMSPMLSPVTPYGLMQHSPMMTSSPPHLMPGFLPYPASPSPALQQTTPLAPPTSSRLQPPANDNNSQHQHQYSAQPPIVPHSQSYFTSTQSMMNTPQQALTSTASLRGSQFTPLLYPYSYGSFPSHH